jgi:hypothetical protein
MKSSPSVNHFKTCVCRGSVTGGEALYKTGMGLEFDQTTKYPNTLKELPLEPQYFYL